MRKLILFLTFFCKDHASLDGKLGVRIRVIELHMDVLPIATSHGIRAIIKKKRYLGTVL